MRRFRIAEDQIKKIYDDRDESGSTEQYPAHVINFFELFEWKKQNALYE